MRFHLLGLILMASVALPADAQTNVERRVGKLEAEMRAVQRRVFPGGNVEPEIRPETPAPEIGGVPASSAVADLTARVDALEAQLATLTGQAEENGYRLRQLEASFARLRTETDSRLNAIEQPAPQPVAAEPPAREPAVREPAAAQPQADEPEADPAEEAYNAGFRLWDQGKYAEAQRRLEAMAKQYPKHRLASWARNLAGRAYLDEGKPATAAKVFLANYQTDPRGERAADSLYFLGQALVQLKKPQDACKVYDELQDVYGATMRDFLKTNLPKARAAAGCS